MWWVEDCQTREFRSARRHIAEKQAVANRVISADGDGAPCVDGRMGLSVGSVAQ